MCTLTVLEWILVGSIVSALPNNRLSSDLIESVFEMQIRPIPPRLVFLYFFLLLQLCNKLNCEGDIFTVFVRTSFNVARGSEPPCSINACATYIHACRIIPSRYSIN